MKYTARMIMLLYCMHSTIMTSEILEKKLNNYEKAQNILLSLPTIDTYTRIKEQFDIERKLLTQWFYDHTTELYVKQLSYTATDASIELGGSYKFACNHCLSDINGFIITKNNNRLEILNQLNLWYRENYPTTCIIKDETSLSLIIKNLFDKKIGYVDLTYSIKTPELYNDIRHIQSIGAFKKFTSKQDKTLYALSVMKAKMDHQLYSEISLKNWYNNP